MSRYTLPLTDILNLEYGYDRPLRNVFAQLWENDGEEPIQHLGLYPFITTVGELMPAIDAMLAPHPGAALSDRARNNISRQLIADGAEPGDTPGPHPGTDTRPDRHRPTVPSVPPTLPATTAASAASAVFAPRRVTQCEGCEVPPAVLDAHEAKQITVRWVLCARHQRESDLLQAGSNGALEATDGHFYF
ncbi:hypothetical protein AB0D08_38280 [Kitasatospora sp. NPDC048540]|uniref:hypothetical protein n=1 Tax=Kitasatospora sp. NPDC048540 TaxID=3155634 RepID=UPI0033DB278F